MRHSQGMFVIDAGVCGADALIGRDKRVEESRRSVDPGSLALDDSRRSHVGGFCVLGQQLWKVLFEGDDECLDLGIGVAVIAVDEGGAQVERVEREVGTQLVGGALQDVSGDRFERRHQLIDEHLDGHRESGIW